MARCAHSMKLHSWHSNPSLDASHTPVRNIGVTLPNMSTTGLHTLLAHALHLYPLVAPEHQRRNQINGRGGIKSKMMHGKIKERQWYIVNKHHHHQERPRGKSN